jgi:hypothetical protein
VQENSQPTRALTSHGEEEAAPNHFSTCITRQVLADFASCFALGALLEEAAQQTQRLGAATASAPVRCAHGSVLW